MPTNNPNPKNDSGGLHTLVRAERLMQIALVLPAAVFIGWGMGRLLDIWLHTDWIYIPGLVLGAISGLVEAVRQALQMGDK